MVHVRYFWQVNYQIYRHTRCIYTVLANPTHEHARIAPLQRFVGAQATTLHTHSPQQNLKPTAAQSPPLRAHTHHDGDEGQHGG